MTLSDEIQELIYHSNYIDGQCGLFKDKFIHHNPVRQFIQTFRKQIEVTFKEALWKETKCECCKEWREEVQELKKELDELAGKELCGW